MRNETIIMPLLNSQARIRKFFDYASFIYDLINPHIYTKEMLETLKNEIEGSKILDVGVGTGYTTMEYENTLGVDLSEKMIHKAKAKGYKGSLLVGDVMQQSFEPETFDTIISAGSFYYFSSPLVVLKTFHSWLRDDGIFLCITPNKKILKPLVNVYSKPELEAMFESSNFKLEKIVELGRKSIKYAYLSKARKAKLDVG
ncbi:MAG: methyltransferase domain-containing protein [Candidatus Aenigmarchaeota archaeon]|nr:methyltransferase domain-containing protein [Candidatus Aenigmarchaeota archaeon]